MENVHQSQVNETGQIKSDDRNLALFSHLAFLGGLVVPFLGLIGPLVLWQMNKDKSTFVASHAVEALNANLTILIALLVSGALCAVLIGFVLLPALFVVGVVFFIKGALAASNGQLYRYPYIFRFIKA